MSSTAPSGFVVLVPPAHLGVAGAAMGCMILFQGALYVAVDADAAAGEAARLLRLTLPGETWAEVIRPPVSDRGAAARIAVLDGVAADIALAAALGRDQSFTGMAVFQGAGDAAPCLYVTTSSIWGGRLLRSVDGIVFEAVLDPGASGRRAFGLRAPTVWGDRLVLTGFGPLDAGGGGGDGVPAGVVLATSDPVAGGWTALSQPGFGDAENLSISALAVLPDGRLCAGTDNPARGFQLWLCEAETGAFRWSALLRDGAYRYAMNPSAAALAVHRGDIYVASGMPRPAGVGGVPDWRPDWAAELIRVEPDGQWDVVVGEARFTPDGLKVPLSLIGPGFEDHGAPCIRALGSHGWLLAGTAAPDGAEGRLWASADGEEWEELDGPDPIGSGPEGLAGIGGFHVAGRDVFIAAGARLLYDRTPG